MYFCLNSISMKYIINAILVILAISCKPTDSDTSTYFGGQIINPKSNYVLFLKDDKVIDSLLLDKNNRFIESYATLEEGLYTFKHGVEFQYIYLEPRDSILIRLNTWDFDESLVFSGKGSSKNEFLINLFLQNEKEEKEMYNYFDLNETEFQAKIDSLTNERVSIYSEFEMNEVNITDGYKKLTDAAIHFPLYRLKEMYPYYHKWTHKLLKSPTVSPTFYNFRDNLNLNEENLVAFYPYQNYIIWYLNNLSFQIQENDSTKSNMTVNLLNTIAEHVELEDFKNSLLKKIVVNDFLKNASTCIVNEEAMNAFFTHCTNQKEIAHVKQLVNDSKIIANKEPLQNFEVISYNNVISDINDFIADNNTVIYFWSTAYMSSEYIVKRIKYLEKNYPNMLFVGVNLHDSFDDIMSEPNLKKLDIERQFKLTKESHAHKFLTSSYPRVILVNNKGVVENGFTYLDSKMLSPELKKLEIK